jgi:hypothetical protein
MRSCFVSCPQKYFREFVEGYRPPGISIDLHAGACFASAVEETYKQIHLHSRPLTQALDVARARFFTEWGNIEIPEWKKTAKTSDRVWEAVESYFTTYSPRTDPVQPYFATDGKPTFEYTFAIPLEPSDGFPLHPNGMPFLYTGRFDMLGTYSGRPVVLDEKTTGGSIGQRWAEQWDLRAQFMGYVWACQQCGIDLDTVVIRGIAIQKTQIVHIEAIKTYTKSLIEKWHSQLRRDLHRLRRCYDEKYFDFNLGDACTAYGNCVFNRVCASVSPESWLQEFEIRHWNPLDKNPAKPEAA